MPSIRQLGAAVLAGTSAVLAHPTIKARQVTASPSNTTSPSTNPPSLSPSENPPSLAPASANPSSGGTASRLEIHELMQDADAWNLYLLAIQSFQSMDPTDPLSWYQIGGIHGEPYVEYNGATQCPSCQAAGYCTHSSTLFPTWHRAYVALFESSLIANAQAVANHFTGDDQQRYLTAAQNLRAPYWDWALAPAQGESPFPEFFTASTVTVNTPSGEQDIPNPLAAYSFGNADSSFADASTTYRGAGTSAGQRQQLRSDLWTLLTSQDNYNEFSTRALSAVPHNPNSLESVHDNVHVAIGGFMTEPEVAGFDPAFWLHHAMVDRALALYQAAWPENWLQSANEVGYTMTYTSGSTQDSQSALEPFNVNSDAVKSTEYYGYNYADLANGESAADIISDLYGGGAPATKAKRSDDSEEADENVRHEYLARVEADLPGTDGSFELFIFDGEPDATAPENWFKDADFLGQHGFFTDGAHDSSNEISLASISLTTSLQRRVESGDLESLDKEVVERYLQKKMQWRVVRKDGKEVPVSDIPMLQVNVVTADVKMAAKRGEMPQWGEFQQLVGCKDDVGAWINGWCANVQGRW